MFCIPNSIGVFVRQNIQNENRNSKTKLQNCKIAKLQKCKIAKLQKCDLIFELRFSFWIFCFKNTPINLGIRNMSPLNLKSSYQISVLI